jgi:hypothetical protein
LLWKLIIPKSPVPSGIPAAANWRHKCGQHNGRLRVAHRVPWPGRRLLGNERSREVFQPSGGQVSLPGSPGCGKVWKRQRSLPVRTSKARGSPLGPCDGPSWVAGPTITRSR